MKKFKTRQAERMEWKLYCNMIRGCTNGRKTHAHKHIFNNLHAHMHWIHIIYVVAVALYWFFILVSLYPLLLAQIHIFPSRISWLHHISAYYQTYADAPLQTYSSLYTLNYNDNCMFECEFDFACVGFHFCVAFVWTQYESCCISTMIRDCITP